MLDPKDNALRTAIENGEGSLIASGFPDVLALEIFEEDKYDLTEIPIPPNPYNPLLESN